MTTIYALKDPRDDSVRYVGQSANQDRRFIGHLGERGPRAGRDRFNWIQQLKGLGLRPVLATLQTCRPCDGDRVEAKWIKHFLPTGVLLNKRIYQPPSKRKRAMTFGARFSPQEQRSIESAVARIGRSAFTRRAILAACAQLD